MNAMTTDRVERVARALQKRRHPTLHSGGIASNLRAEAEEFLAMLDAAQAWEREERNRIAEQEADAREG